MGISSELISEFVKVTNDTKTDKQNETTVYGTVKEYSGSYWVQLDGSDQLTPITTTTDVKPGERVMVMIKNHTATVTGNISSPSAQSKDVGVLDDKVKDAGSKISEFEIVMAYSVTTDDLNAINATIGTLRAKVASIGNLEALNAEIDSLEARFADIDKVTAKDVEALNAEIENLRAKFGEFTDISTEDLEALNVEINNLKAYTADFTYVSADRLSAFRADIENLNTNKLSAKEAALKYANIDFANITEAAIKKLFSDTGLIKDLIVGDGTITGKLVGVTITGDLIEGNTVKADKLVVKGSDGLYYKLNFEGGKFAEGEQVPTDSLHGSVITAKSITAEKVSVKDLVAFGATIGGFEITDNSIHTIAKTSVDNTTRGIYFDNDAQFAIGDATNFFKYYKDQNGNYKLEISIVNKVQSDLNNLKIGGRNLVPVSRIREGRNVATTKEFVMGGVWATPFIDNEELVEILEPDTEYTIRYNLELIEKTTVPTKFDMMVGFLIYSAAYSTWVQLSTGMPDTAVIGDKKSVQITFTTPAEWRDEAMLCYSRRWTTDGASPVGFDTFKVTDFKIEKGNRATDWTPAPEDMATGDDLSSNIEILNQTILEQAAQIKSENDKLLFDALEKYVESDGEDYAALKEAVAALELSSSGILARVSKTEEDLLAVDEDLQKKFNEISLIFSITVDGVTIGRTESPYKLFLDDNEFSMQINGNRVLWFEINENEKSANIPELNVTDRFTLFGLEGVKDKNGNVNWIPIGG